ncbi:hypothetical protein BACCIP111883_00036 [Sutcliffiella rhizosphaerae]|uniref:Prepilin-type N-terminal cleavage/methylation domain-containing protein n=1 Tax=Sutcliffiella rhizosphaerae TaxID=2880967 RepID=A0ABM8YHI9_9BACI|nr:hypothetical protein BACCIP111883_00036 [Sutcliffiella rhizosphaerae]
MIHLKWEKVEEGFTLLESLLILSFVSILLSITVLKLSTMEDKHIGRYFIEQFNNDLLFAQQYALSTRSNVHVIFMPTNNSYLIRQGTFQATTLVTRSYHRTIQIDTRTMGERFAFLGNGSIDKSGALIVSVDGLENYRYVFTLGKGRFYVEER